jgi:hypothetical protein
MMAEAGPWPFAGLHEISDGISEHNANGKGGRGQLVI